MGIAIGVILGWVLSWSGILPCDGGVMEQPVSSVAEETRQQRNLIDSKVTEISYAETEIQKASIEESADVFSADTSLNEPVANIKAAVVEKATEEPIRLQILNGCGAKGITRLVTPALNEFGFDVRETGNAKNYRHKTSKIYSRTGEIALAYRVADSVGVDRSLVSELVDTSITDIDVTIVIGSDYSKLNFGLKNREGEEQAER